MSADPPVAGSVDGVDVFEPAPSTSRSSSANDPATGLRAIIAIHSTALGPRARRHPVLPLRLDRRRARRRPQPLARHVLQGRAGRARPRRRQGRDHRRPRPGASQEARGAAPRLRPVRAVARRPLLTACDVGTYSADMDDIARECDYVTGRTVAHGGAGDSSVLTAYGVFQGMRAAAEFALGLADAWPAGPSASPASARSATTWSRTSRGRRRASSSPTSTPPRSTGSARSSPRSRVVASADELVASAARRLRAVRHGWRAHRRGRRRAERRRSSAAPPTTSSRTRASRRRSRSAASSTRPTTA